MRTVHLTLTTRAAITGPIFGEHILAPTSGTRFFELAIFLCQSPQRQRVTEAGAKRRTKMSKLGPPDCFLGRANRA